MEEVDEKIFKEELLRKLEELSSDEESSPLELVEKLVILLDEAREHLNEDEIDETMKIFYDYPQILEILEQEKMKRKIKVWN